MTMCLLWFSWFLALSLKHNRPCHQLRELLNISVVGELWRDALGDRQHTGQRWCAYAAAVQLLGEAGHRHGLLEAGGGLGEIAPEGVAAEWLGDLVYLAAAWVGVAHLHG